jgi:hypothetical protein
MVSSLMSGCIVEESNARGKPLFYPFLFPVPDEEVDVIGITEVFLFELPLTLKEP